MRARSNSKVSLEAASPLPVVSMCPHQNWLSTAFNHSPRGASPGESECKRKPNYNVLSSSVVESVREQCS